MPVVAKETGIPATNPCEFKVTTAGEAFDIVTVVAAHPMSNALTE